MAKTLTCQGGTESSCFDPHINEPPITLRLKFSFLDPTTTTSAAPSLARTKRFDASLPPRLAMNEWSYAMCTENLGNETGCEMTETALFAYESTARRENVETKKCVSRNEFPPPLTTMSRAEPILMSPCREGGRLIIKAVRSPPSRLRVERSEGRLRMCVLGSCDEEAVMDESLDGMAREGADDVVMVKVGGGGGTCKQGEPQDSTRLFNWEPFNWVATT